MLWFGFRTSCQNLRMHKSSVESPGRIDFRAQGSSRRLTFPELWVSAPRCSVTQQTSAAVVRHSTNEADRVLG